MADTKQALNLRLPPDVIRAIKRAAIDAGTTASQVVENMARQGIGELRCEPWPDPKKRGAK